MQEMYGNILDEILILQIWTSKISNKIEGIRTMFCFDCFVSFLYYILRRGGTEHDTFSIDKIHKSLDVNFISIKKH